MKEFSVIEQEKLLGSRVLVIGAGGLGSPVLLYLTAAGEDIGQDKLESAIHRLEKLNPNTTLIPHPVAISSSNAMSIIKDYDLVIDGSDNFPTRYLVNDACVLSNKPYIYGSVLRFEGQVSVFNQLLEDGKRSPNYRDLFPTITWNYRRYAG